MGDRRGPGSVAGSAHGYCRRKQAWISLQRIVGPITSHIRLVSTGIVVSNLRISAMSKCIGILGSAFSIIPFLLLSGVTLLQVWCSGHCGAITIAGCANIFWSVAKFITPHFNCASLSLPRSPDPCKNMINGYFRCRLASGNSMR